MAINGLKAKKTRYNIIFAVEPPLPYKTSCIVFNEFSLNNLYYSVNVDNLDDILVENNINKSIELLHSKLWRKTYDLLSNEKQIYIS